MLTIVAPSPLRRSLWLVAAYLGLAFLWEAAVDPLMHAWLGVGDLRLDEPHELVKDLAFVAVSALLLGVLAYRLGARRMHQDERLQAAEERLRLAFEGSMAGVWEAEVPPGAETVPDEIYLSPNLVRLIGFHPDDFPHSLTAWRERVHPDDIEAVERAARRHFEGEAELYDATYRVRHRDGSWRWIQSRGRLLETEEGAHRCWTGIDLDVTRRREHEESRRRFRAVLRSVLRSSPAAIVQLDEETRVWLWNPAATELFGWTEEDVLGKPFPVTLGKRRALGEMTERLLAVEGVTGETTAVRKDGDERQVALAAAATRAAGGEVLGYVGIFQDITGRKEAERRLRETQKQLARARRLEALGRLAGGVAHDFNNMLTVILGEVQLLETEAKTDEVEEGLRSILSAAERAGGLARQLLAFGSSESPSPEAVDLAAELEDAERLLRRTLHEGIDLDCHVEGEPPAALIDPTHVHQILVNLCVNAEDAMPEGGTLKVWVEQREVLDEQFRHGVSVEPGRYVAVVVEDTGHGMDAETRERIFDPFFTTKDRGEGTGLGLSTVYGIVRDAGGIIDVESEPGRGTRFTVLLPALDDTVDEDLDGTDRATAATAREDARKVLVVEDDPTVRDLVERFLQGSGYQTVAVETAADALRVLDDGHRIDVVLTDVLLTGDMTGPQLSRRISEHLPVVFMSGHTADTEAVGRAREANIPYVAKPFDQRELTDAIRRAMDARRGD